MIVVLRLGHRLDRDKRVTTHVAMTARAFGADKIVIPKEDKKLEKTLNAIVRKFGGSFEIESGVNWKNYIKEWKGAGKGYVVHLTMYGERLEKVIQEIFGEENLLLIVGAEKVPAEVYLLADYNVSAGNQPHSEVAALAIFLDRVSKGGWLNKQFENAEIKILPCRRGKNVQTHHD